MCRMMVRISAIVIAAVFEKRTQTTPAQLIAVCQQRLKAYDQIK